MSFIDSLFSSTSCVCVTGLQTIDIASKFTLFGEIVSLLLIQFGGLGFVTIASLLYMIIGKKINYQTRRTFQKSLNADDNAGILKMVRNIIVFPEVFTGKKLSIALIEPFANEILKVSDVNKIDDTVDITTFLTDALNEE